jgi:hypothetical protein
MHKLIRLTQSVSLAALSAGLVIAAAPRTAAAQAVSPDTLLAHVRYLASDALAGREAGESGADSAAAYIAREMKAYGLEPLGTDGYRQPFEIVSTIAIGSDSRLILRTSRGTRALELYEDWLPFAFSSGGRVSGRVFDAGYGLSEDVYADVRDREGGFIALLEAGVPDDFDPHSTGIDPSPRRKATLAREQGAEAALITVSRIAVPQPGDPPHAVGIPAIQIVADDDLRAWLEDESLEITLDARVEPLRAEAYNVVGKLMGRDPDLADEYIVIGAHYDHLGLGGPGWLVTAPHNGADDNASGTSALLGLAKYYGAHPEARPGRSLAFVAFSAEEMGLLGSDYFVSHAPFPLEQVAAMVNFDMVGRLRDENLQVFGTETAKEFSALLDSLDAASQLKLSYIGDGYGPSDQTSFYARDIPVLHLFTGTHSEYHRPEDDWETINAAGLAEVTDFAIALVDKLGNSPGPFTLVKQERPVASGGGGYGPYLGTVPDFGEVEGGGLRLSAIRPGSPADKAGLQAGDVVVEFGGKEVLNIYDYTYALRDHAPGDTVLIKVRRAADVVELTAVLGKRQ